MPTRDRAAVCGLLELSHRLNRRWGAGVGLPLLCAYYRGEVWQTAAQIAEAGQVSEDTARRRLAELVTAGRVQEDRSGRSLRFSVVPEQAAKSLAGIRAFLTAANCGE